MLAAVAGGESQEEIATGVLAGAARAGHPEPGTLRQPLALVRQQRRVGGEDDDDRAGARVAAD